MKIPPGRLFWGILCICLAMTTSVLAEESEFSKHVATAKNATNSLRERMAAIHYLALSGEEAALKPMLALLLNSNEKEGIRCEAARGLADLGQGRTEAISNLEQVYRGSGAAENLRYTILLSLGRMRAEESLPLLNEALSDPSEMIRFKAAQAIGSIGNDSAVTLLLTRMEKEEDSMVRAEVVRALGEAKSARARQAILQALLSDSSSLVRWNAALTLNAFKPLSPEVRSALQPALNDPSPMVRETVKGMLR